MNTNHFKLLFLILVLTLLVPVLISNRYTHAQSVETIEAQRDLAASCLSALKKAYSYSENESGNIFATEEQRQEAVKTFFINFTNCVSDEMNTDSYYHARYLIPAIAMIDNDGYYLMYSKLVMQPDGSNTFTDVITPLYSWSNTYGPYTVKFFLDGTVEVRVDGQPTIYKGYYKKVYDKLASEYDVTAINFLADLNDYTNEKKLVIVSSLQKNVEYTINNHNDFNNLYDTQYSFQMPVIKDDIEDVIDGPCFLAFEQGSQKNISTDVLNIYSLASADVVGKEFYYVTDDNGNKEYHRHDCNKLSNATTIMFGTAKNCAKQGASPCECIR